MSKFNVGDKVIAKKGAPHVITTNGWTGVVEKVKYGTFDAGGFINLDCDYFDKLTYNKIVITTDGKTTLARLYHDKKVVKSVEAKCSPDDDFDFMIGAKLAFDRLSENEVPKYKVGDKVKVRSDLKEIEYFSPYGDRNDVVDDMIKLRGKTVIISKVSNTGTYKIENDIYDWIDTMFEGYSDEPEFYNGKVVCIKTNYTDFLTVGKIYKFEDGFITYDNGKKSRTCVKNFDEIETNFDSKFIEIKEDK